MRIKSVKYNKYAKFAVGGMVLHRIVSFINVIYLERKGFISALFLLFYSTFRFFIEFFREPDVQIGYLFFNLTMGQILSIILLIFGFYIYLKKKDV